MNRPPVDLNIEQRGTDAARSIHLSGRLDAHQVPAFLGAAQPLAPHTTLDLAGVTFMDSSGLAALVKLVRSAREQATSVEIVNVQDAVRLAMEITGLYAVLPIRTA